ncbi:MAG: hypothetical protein AB7O52_18740 [Planctomycetota bacterium]
MKAHRWLRDEADERLEGLFSDDPDEVHVSIRDLLESAEDDPEIEDLLAETLRSSLDKEHDDTQASVWIVLILGQIGTELSLPVLLAALSSSDEALAATAVRSLQLLGREALEAALERLEEDEDVEPSHFAAVCEVLEGVQLHDLPDVRARIEDCLIEHLRKSAATEAALLGNRLRTTETAALTLAHLGVAGARADVERVVAKTGGTNAFLLDAVEIMNEQPGGIPFRGGTTWENEFERTSAEGFADGGGNATDGPQHFDLEVEETSEERILRLRRRPS